MFYRHFWFLITKGQDICSLNMKLSPIWYNYTDKRKNDIQFLSTCTNTTSQFCRQGQSDTKRWTNRRTVGWTIIRNHFHARIQRIFQGGGLSLQGCLRHIAFNVNLKKFDSAGEGWGWDSRPPLRSANDLQIYAFMYCIMIWVTTLGCRWDVTNDTVNTDQQ